MAAKKKTVWNFVSTLEGDKVVWMIALMLILVSIVCIFSSTSRLLEGDETRLDMVKSQLFIVAAGLSLIVICYHIKSLTFYRACSSLGFLVSAVLLGLLLSRVDNSFVKSIELNGARRILQIAGFQIHVFEVVKVAMVLYLSWALDAWHRNKLPGRSSDKLKKLLYIYAPFLLTIVMIIPGSNSAALLVGGIMFIVILLAGGNFKELSILAVSAVITIGICFGVFKLSEGRYMTRIGTAISRVMDSEDEVQKVLDAKVGSREYYDALDEIRQPYSAKIAVKEGGFLGKGPGQSTQRYVVPDISEDYMFSFIIEEYGVCGAIIIIFLYVSLMARAAIIVRNCGSRGKNLYAKLAVAGLAILITGQAFLHMFVNVDIGPMTGQTLPLISHGNSAFLCFSLAFGIILSISRIASRSMAREQKAEEPIVLLHETEATLKDLDDFESEDNGV